MASATLVTERRGQPGGPSSPFSWCRLAEQPDHLVPQPLMRQFGSNAEGHKLFLNPQLIASGSLPPEIAERGVPGQPFAQPDNVVWVKHPGPGVWQAFELSAGLTSALESILSGRPDSILPPAARHLLRAAEILVEEDYVKRKQQLWHQALRQCTRHWEDHSFAPIRNLVHPFHLSWLRRYYRRLVRTGQLQFGDGQNLKRYCAHNEIVARLLHHQLTPVLNAITGNQLKPSYVYFVSYQPGAELHEHTDRPQCQVSISFCLDYAPEPILQTPWPLCLRIPSGTVTIYQAIGDALVYAGDRLPHWRDRLSSGHTSTSLLFHYVSEDFAGSLD